MTKAIFGNHSAVIVPRQDRDSIRQFYCDVLGGAITKAEGDRDFLRMDENFYIAFLYGDVPDEREFLRTARSIWLEIKSDSVEDRAKESSSPVWRRGLRCRTLTCTSRLLEGNASS